MSSLHSDDKVLALENRIRELETKLTESEMLSSLAKEYPHPVFKLSSTGEILFANEPAKSIDFVVMAGKTISFQEYWKHFTASLSENWSIAHTEVFAGETTYSFYLKLHLKEGYIDVFGTDIGEQKSHIERLISTFQNFDSAILVENQDRKIVTTNQAFCDLFNVPVSPDMMEGQDCSNSAEQSKHLFREPGKFVSRINEILSKRQLVLNEEIEFANNRILERDYIPLFVNGKYNGHLWKYTDITAKRNAETRLANREKKFRGIINNFKLGLLEVDENDNILGANDAFCAMSGYSMQELKGRKASVILLDSVDSDVMKEKLLERQEGKEDVYEIKIKNRRNQERYWLISGSPLLTDSGEVIGSIGIHWDITDIRMLEQELLKARNQAEEASRNKAKFLANMSHEIRTPLTGIMGLIEQLSKSELTDAQRQQTALINSASQTLLNIVNDVLDVSKIEAGKFHLELLPFSLEETMSRIISLLNGQAKEKAIFLSHTIDARIAKTYQGDSHRISQILFNIIGNAIKFTEIGGVDVHCDLYQQKEKLDYLRISIRDTGIGMDKEFIQRMFGEFEQASISSARKYGGSGLGMHITRNLVKLMDGQLRVESEKNRGTLVEITLPLERANASMTNTIVEMPVDGSALIHSKILITDDYALNRIVLKTVLEKYQVEIHEAENGLQALEILKQFKIDLVLMDAQMPMMNGMEATIKIRETISKDIPIIGLSASALTEEINACLNAGMDDYIIKPYTENQLLSALSKWIDKGKKSSNFELTKLDFSKLMEYVGDNKELLLNVLVAYQSFLPLSIERLEKAVLTKNIEDIRIELHQIRPNLENLKLSPTRCSFNELSSMLKTNGVSEEASQHLQDILHIAKTALILIQSETAPRPV